MKGQTANTWFELMGRGLDKMMGAAMRKPEGLKAKMEEMATIGDSAKSPAVPKYATAPEKAWDSPEECAEALKNLEIPVGYCFGSEDPLSTEGRGFVRGDLRLQEAVCF